jgi:nitrogen fixation/metabolism regulation signal transduction histidine kinase
MRINSGSNCFNPDEKAKPNISCYEPTVIDLTKIINGKIEITVKDKGNGFPDAIKEKIFQPFLQPNQQARERDWDYYRSMIL